MSMARPYIKTDWRSLAGSDEQTLRGALVPVMERYESRIAALELELRLREEQLRAERMKRYGPKGDRLNDAQIELLELEPSVELVEADKEADLPEAQKSLRDRLVAARAELEEEKKQAKQAAKQAAKESKGTAPAEIKCRGGRNMFPAHLARVEQIIPCLEAPEGKLIGYDIKEELVVKPVEVFVRVIKREKRLVTDGINSAVFVPAPVPCLVPKGQLSDEAIIALAIGKYCDHLPIYRQMEIWKRCFGLEFSRSTAVRAIMEMADVLQPLAKHILTRILKSPVVQADETRVMVLQKEGKGHNDTAWFWQYSTGKLVYFDFRSGRGRDGPGEILKDFEGIVQSDAYAGYNNAAPKALARAGCWAHVRRKFVEAHNASPVQSRCLHSAHIIALIDLAYVVEELARSMGLEGEDRLAHRKKQQQELKIANAFAAIEEAVKSSLPQSKLGKACAYALSNRKRLEVFLSHGEVEIDNNLCENAMRPLALGRKNWLHLGDQDSGPRVAILSTLLASAKRSNINPMEYLTDVVRVFVALKDKKNPPVEILDSLLPDRWVKPAVGPVTAS